MVMTTVLIEEHVQTMCRQAAVVGWVVRRGHWQGEDEKKAFSERKRACSDQNHLMVLK
jgi:hypothetical protein